MINSEKGLHMKKSLNLLFITLFVSQGQLYAQEAEQLSWLQRVKSKIAVLFSSQSSQSKKKSDQQLKADFDSLAEITLSKLAIDEKSVAVATKILGILHTHLPENLQKQITELANNAPQSTFVEKQVATFGKNPAAQDAPDILISAWKQEPVTIIYFIVRALPHYMALLASNADQKTIDAAMQKIKAL